MSHGNPKRFCGLPGKSASAGIDNGSGDHDRQPDFLFPGQLFNGINCGLAVQGIEHRFYKEKINTTFNKAFELLAVVVDDFFKGYCTVTRIINVR